MSATLGPRVRLGELTGVEAARALAGKPVILIPLGSLESHGPGLPMGDYLAAERIAVAIAGRAADSGTPCLVAPVLPFGGADYFGSVPGGIALAQSTLRAVLSDIVGALLRHGLDRLVIVNGHGGNSQAIHEVTLAVRRSHRVVIPSLYVWKAAAALLRAQPGADGIGHGGEPMASIAMHLFGTARPAAVAGGAGAMFGLEVTDFASVALQGVPIDLPLELDEIAPDGIAPGADPSCASAATGRMLTERLTGIGAALVALVAVRAAARMPS